MTSVNIVVINVRGYIMDNEFMETFKAICRDNKQVVDFVDRLHSQKDISNPEPDEERISKITALDGICTDLKASDVSRLVTEATDKSLSLIWKLRFEVDRLDDDEFSRVLNELTDAISDLDTGVTALIGNAIMTHIQTFGI